LGEHDRRARDSGTRRLLLEWASVWSGDLGKALEGTGAFDDAIALYSRGIEVDAQAEQLYQRLMTCYQQTGRAAEAEAAYQRCIAGLATGTPRRPSAETEYLRRMIRGSAPR